MFCVTDAEKFKPLFLFLSIRRLRDVGWTDVRPTQNARLPWSYDGNGVAGGGEGETERVEEISEAISICRAAALDCFL